MDNINITLDDLNTGVGIMVSIIGIIVAVKTYNRAKKNILQPMKSAVVNQQTALFVAMVQIFKNDFSSIETEMYIESIHLTIFSYLVDRGYILKNHEEVVKEIKANNKIRVYVGENNQVDSLTVIQPFKTKTDKNETSIKGKEKYIKFKDGVIDLEFICLGESYIKCKNELNKYLNNPLVPKVINDNIQELNSLLEHNIKNQLKDSVISFLKEYATKDNESPEAIGVYNMFNRKRYNSKPIIESIEKEVRNYLRIDEEWD